MHCVRRGGSSAFKYRYVPSRFGVCGGMPLRLQSVVATLIAHFFKLVLKADHETSALSDTTCVVMKAENYDVLRRMPDVAIPFDARIPVVCRAGLLAHVLFLGV